MGKRKQKLDNSATVFRDFQMGETHYQHHAMNLSMKRDCPLFYFQY